MAYPGPCAPREDRTPHQICADDNDVALRTPCIIHLWLPVQGSESGEGLAEDSCVPSEGLSRVHVLAVESSWVLEQVRDRRIQFTCSFRSDPVFG